MESNEMFYKRWIGFLALASLALLLVAGWYLGTVGSISGVEARADEHLSATQGALLALASDPLAQGSAQLLFAPSPAQMTAGEVAAVQLRLENVSNLYGIEVHLTFDPRVVQVEDDDAGREGVQIAVGEIPVPEFLVQNVADNIDGRIDYAVVQLAPRPAANGSGVVATIHFRGVSEGTSPIRFTGAKLASPEGFEIAVTWQEGAIFVGAPSLSTDTPTPTLSPEEPTLTPTSPSPPPNTPSPTASAFTAVPTQPTQPTAAPLPSPTPLIAGQCPVLYVVRSGDTAFSVARRFSVSLDALAAANALSSSYYIQIGQLLTIPGVPGPTAITHVVQAGDTLYSIARRYGASVETLAAINRLPHPWHAPLGQTLLICPSP